VYIGAGDLNHKNPSVSGFVGPHGNGSDIPRGVGTVPGKWKTGTPLPMVSVNGGRSIHHRSLYSPGAKSAVLEMTGSPLQEFFHPIVNPLQSPFEISSRRHKILSSKKSSKALISIVLLLRSPIVSKILRFGVVLSVMRFSTVFISFDCASLRVLSTSGFCDSSIVFCSSS